MKKFMVFLLASLCLMCAGCKKSAPEKTVSEITGAETTTEDFSTVSGLELEELDPAKVLTVYFSHNDEVKKAASYISEATKGGIFEVKTVNSYPENEDELANRAVSEHKKNLRPALVGAPENLWEYNIVFLCFPAWDGTMPMALWTFVEDYDMRDKVVIPVCFGDKNSLESAERDIHTLAPQMFIAEGFSFESDFLSVGGDFSQWLDRILYG